MMRKDRKMLDMNTSHDSTMSEVMMNEDTDQDDDEEE
jgi:hypothetical protein